MQAPLRAVTITSWLFLILIATALCACGVKGPPLPPISSTPEQSDRMDARSSAEAVKNQPSPLPSHQP